MNKSIVVKDSAVMQHVDSVVVKTETKESNTKTNHDYERETTIVIDTFYGDRPGKPVDIKRWESDNYWVINPDGSITMKSKIKSVVVKEKGAIKTNAQTIEVNQDSTAKKEDKTIAVHSSTKTVQKEAKPYTWLYIAAFITLLISLFIYAWFTIKNQK